MSFTKNWLMVALVVACNNEEVKDTEDDGTNQTIEPASDGPTAEPAYEGPGAEPTEPGAEPNEPGGEPGGGPGGPGQEEEAFAFFTDYWSGEFTMTNDELIGFEKFEFANAQQEEDTLACSLIWDVTGIPSPNPFCDDCEYNFDITAVPQTDNSNIISLEDCVIEWGVELTFQYAYTSNFIYYGADYGEAMLVSGKIIDGGNTEEPWVVPSYVNEGFPAFEDNILFDETDGSFTYSRGFKNYFQSTEGGNRN